MQEKGTDQYPERLTFGWTKFRGAGHTGLPVVSCDSPDSHDNGSLWEQFL